MFVEIKLHAVLCPMRIFICLYGICFIDCVKLNNFFQSFKQSALRIRVVQQAFGAFCTLVIWLLCWHSLSITAYFNHLYCGLCLKLVLLMLCGLCLNYECCRQKSKKFRLERFTTHLNFIRSWFWKTFLFKVLEKWIECTIK